MSGLSHIVSLRNSHCLPPKRPFFFERAVHAISAPILIVDALAQQKNIVHTNAALEHLTGYSADEVLGSDWTSLFIQNTGESLLEEILSALEDGQTAGANFQIRRKRGASVWTEIQISPIHDELGVATHYIVVLRDLTEERRTREELEYYAHHDLLTGLPNRRLLETRLECALSKSESSGGSFSIVVLDLNSFKLVNDRFGHDAGDELLKCVGQRLRQCVREEDTVARLGGDEFVLLLESDERAYPETIISRVAQCLRHPISLNGRLVAASCSSGIGRYPTDGRDASALLKAADQNLYRAKAKLGPSRAASAFARVGIQCPRLNTDQTFRL